MPRRGRTFEKLVAHLERFLDGTDGSTKIESPGYLDDNRVDHGRKGREFDVLLTTTQAQNTSITAIEAKDWSKPVDIPVIDAFSCKCQATGVHRRIIVSAVGFSRTALQAAQVEGIECVSLENVESFPWLAATYFTLARIVPQQSHVHFQIQEHARTRLRQECEALGVLPTDVEFELLNSDGEVVPRQKILALAWKTAQDADRAALDKEDPVATVRPPAKGSTAQVDVPFSPPWAIRPKGTESTFEVGKAVCYFVYDIEHTLLPISNKQYTDADGSIIASLAHSEPFIHEGKEVRFGFVEKPDKTKQAVILLDQACALKSSDK